MEWSAAHELAVTLMAPLSPACVRLEVAGSLRREKPDVKDIELVAIPRVEVETDLFGEPAGGRSLLDTALDRCVAEGVLAWDTNVKRNGPRYKRFSRVCGVNIVLDLFVAEEANWGNVFAIRTGNGDFSKALVTQRQYGGLMPSALNQQDGYLWRTHPDGRKERLECPTEAHFFAYLGVSVVPPPRERTAEKAEQMARSAV
jgi:DNA polymerase/3'-5' exonuclease PolX